MSSNKKRPISVILLVGLTVLRVLVGIVLLIALVRVIDVPIAELLLVAALVFILLKHACDSWRAGRPSFKIGRWDAWPPTSA